MNPSIICGYRVTRQLAPATFLATNDRGDLIVLKKLPAGCLLQGRLHPAILARLQRIRELPVPAVANFYGVERDGELPYLIWAYAEGQPLDEFIKNAPAAPSVLREVKLAIESLHAAGLVHGAIHAGNVIVDGNQVPRLTHISPLLFHEPAIDEAALAEILERLEHRAQVPIAGESRGGNIARGRMILTALAVTCMAFAVAAVVYYYGR